VTSTIVTLLFYLLKQLRDLVTLLRLPLGALQIESSINEIFSYTTSILLKGSSELIKLTWRSIPQKLRRLHQEIPRHYPSSGGIGPIGVIGAGATGAEAGGADLG